MNDDRGMALERDAKTNSVNHYDSLAAGFPSVQQRHRTQRAKEQPRGDDGNDKHTNDSSRIHILGTGSIGKLVAHSLRGLPNPPSVTLVFHRYQLLAAWRQGQGAITLQKDGSDLEAFGFDVELAVPDRREFGKSMERGTASVYDVRDQSDRPQEKPHDSVHWLYADQERRKDDALDSKSLKTESVRREGEGSGELPLHLPGRDAVSSAPIHHLILTTKTIHSVPALSAVKHRLSKESTICFLQNGMGVIDEINEHVFPVEETRPNYLQGVVSHGANVPPEKVEQNPFYVVHAGAGTIALGVVETHGRSPPSSTILTGEQPPGELESVPASSRYLLQTLCASPPLCAAAFTPSELLQLQLEKLAVNSIVNPLTALVDSRNGSLLYNFPLTRTMRLMLAETSHVIRTLPELQGIPNLDQRFSAIRMESLVVNVMQRTANNISSMLADVRSGRQTEIDYINGYIIRRGEEMDIKCVVNYAIMQVVQGKALMAQRERYNDVPTKEDNLVNILGTL